MPEQEKNSDLRLLSTLIVKHILGCYTETFIQDCIAHKPDSLVVLTKHLEQTLLQTDTGKIEAAAAHVVENLLGVYREEYIEDCVEKRPGSVPALVRKLEDALSESTYRPTLKPFAAADLERSQDAPKETLSLEGIATLVVERVLSGYSAEAIQKCLDTQPDEPMTLVKRLQMALTEADTGKIEAAAARVVNSVFDRYREEYIRKCANKEPDSFLALTSRLKEALTASGRPSPQKPVVENPKPPRP